MDCSIRSCVCVAIIQFLVSQEIVSASTSWDVAVKNNVVNRKGVAEFFDTASTQDTMEVITDTSNDEAGENVSLQPIGRRETYSQCRGDRVSLL